MKRKSAELTLRKTFKTVCSRFSKRLMS